ncbi:MAG: YdcF family protein [Clostridia bacterium]|nr:YdcF family protein [Clostridia bacterium]
MVLLFIILGVFALYLTLNLVVILSARSFVMELDEGKKTGFQADAILVLGAGVRPDKTPSHMLEDRLLTALALYQSDVCARIIVSGDHGGEYYDEVNVMKGYLVDRGVPSECVFMDHAGFDTYDSLYRAKAIFGAKSLLLVTQRYHSYRAVYIGERLGVSCRAVAAPILSHSGTGYAKQPWFTFRETVARAKDVFTCLIRPAPRFLGDPVDLSGSGDVTNDK